MSLRYKIYQSLWKKRDLFFQSISKEIDKLKVPPHWKGEIGLTGSNSARPAFLRSDIVRAVTNAARSPTSLIRYLDEIRELVKLFYGDDFDGLPVSTCEAGLWLVFDTFGTPPSGGRGSAYRTAYLGLYEKHIEHHLSYGRPFPPRYRDIFADRGGTSGEQGIPGRRLNDLDVIIVPMEGATYQVHGVKPSVVPLLSSTSASETISGLRRTMDRHADRLTMLVSLGYDTPGYGYGPKKDGQTPDLQVGMGRLAREYDVLYIVDNARAVPFVGAHPGKMGAHIMLFSMDKVAGAPIGGLIIGREELLVPLKRAMGFLSERCGSGPAYEKAVFAAFDPGRESLAGQAEALRWIQKNPSVIRDTVDSLFDIVYDEFEPLKNRYQNNEITITKTYNSAGVEINYENTWTETDVGLPIFSSEDGAAGTNLLVKGLNMMEILPPVIADGNISITTGRGLVDPDGCLIPERARLAVRALVRVLLILSEMAAESKERESSSV